MRIIACLLLAGCAVGYVSDSGRAYGVALGQAELRSCRAEPPSEASCSYIRGGALSAEGAKAIGPLQSLLGILVGLI